jgi:hypothetical protein
MMFKHINIEMENCYGIDNLSHRFDFSNNNMPVLIYAPNGVMKTSFAKALRQYSENKSPEDIFFPERESVLSITDDSGSSLEREFLFVIDSINESINLPVFQHY